MLVTADWSGPARPATTVLRELSRRWGDAVQALAIDASKDTELDLLEVDVVPTWLRLVQVTEPEATGTGDGGNSLIVRDLRGTTPMGEETLLAGLWKLTHRRTGALPKHQIADELGPDAPASEP